MPLTRITAASLPGSATVFVPGRGKGFQLRVRSSDVPARVELHLDGRLANAVNVAHPAIGRARACELRADSDLGDLPVTVQVGILPAPARAEALHQGCALARRLQRQGLIHAAYLALQGEIATVLPPGMPAEPAVCRSVAAKKS